MDSKFFFSKGKQNIKLSKVFQKYLPHANSIKIVSGYVTKKGFNAAFNPKEDPVRLNSIASKLEYILVGRLTRECADIFDALYPAFKSKLFVNLGIGQVIQSQGRTSVSRFVPMIHSKIIAFDPNSHKNLFYIGSANLTHYALEDLNAEAGLLLEHVDGNIRGEIDQYMDDLLSLKSTMPYNPSLRPHLVHLSNLGSKTRIYRANIGNLQREILIISCLAYDYIPQIGNILFTDLPAYLPDSFKNFFKKIDKYLILTIFSSEEDFLDFRFSNAHITYTITRSINDIQEVNRSIEQNIDGVLIIPQDEFPYIYKISKAPLDPIGMEFQIKCRVIPKANIPRKIRNLFEMQTKDDTLLVENLIVSKRKACQTVEFNWDNSFFIENKQYAEISYFEMEPTFKTLSNTREKLEPLRNELREITFEKRKKAKEEFYEVINDEKEEIPYMKLEEKSPIKEILPSIKKLTTKEGPFNLFIFKASSFLEDR